MERAGPPHPSRGSPFAIDQLGWRPSRHFRQPSSPHCATQPCMGRPPRAETHRRRPWGPGRWRRWSAWSPSVQTRGPSRNRWSFATVGLCDVAAPFRQLGRAVTTHNLPDQAQEEGSSDPGDSITTPSTGCTFSAQHSSLPPANCRPSTSQQALAPHQSCPTCPSRVAQGRSEHRPARSGLQPPPEPAGRLGRPWVTAGARPRGARRSAAGVGEGEGA